jgi:S1-C subfamily serine protease
VLVASVVPGAPGAKAGLAVGDVIVSVRGQKIAAAPDVLAALTGAGSGDRAKVELVRDRKPVMLDATLGDGPIGLMLPSWLRDWMKPFEQTARK